jgi:hypothetical protein
MMAHHAFADELKVSISPTVGTLQVSGDEDKFQEDWWRQDGLKGGVEKFSLQSSLSDNTSLKGHGHAQIADEDYAVELELLSENTASLRAGFSQYSKYFDDTGGFFEPFADSSFDLDRDLELDIGKIFLEARLIMPELPKILLGYEHRFKKGEKSLTGWGSVTQSGVTRNIFPAFKEMDETVDIFKAEVEHTIKKVTLHDRFRYEHFQSDTKRFEEQRDLDAGTRKTVQIDDSQRHNSLFNTLYTEMRISEKLYASMGYLFSDHDGDGDFKMLTNPFAAPFDKNWSASQVDLNQDSHIINLNAMVGPYKDIQMSGGIEGEVTETEGDTDAVLTEIGFGGNLTEPEARILTRKDLDGLKETLGLKYTGLTRTTLFAEGKWIQQDIDLKEQEFEDSSLNFQRVTDSDRRISTYKIGFSTSPFRRVTLSAHYRRKDTCNDYDHKVDTEPLGYSAFIREKDITTNEVRARISVQPKTWLRTSFEYRLEDTEIDTIFDNNLRTVQSGNYDANIYSLDITLTPISNLFLTTVQSYRDIRGVAFDNDLDAVILYEGDIFSSINSISYILNEKNEFRLEYIYSRTDNFENNSKFGLPLLHDDLLQRVQTSLSHDISDNMKAKLTYGYYDYKGDHNDGVDDYSAHMAGVSFQIHF